MRLLCWGVWLALAASAQTPVITTVAGNGARGFSGDGGPALSAQLALADLQNPCDPVRFEQTSHIAFDAAGNLLIADSGNHRIRRVSTDGVISTVAGTGEKPATDSRCNVTGAVGDRLYNPAGIAVLPNGSLVIADQLNNRIRLVTPAGVMTTIAGNGTHNLYAPGIPATASPMDWPTAVAVDAAGLVYFAELHSNRIARIGADGRLTTIAGTGFPGYNGDGIPATAAQLNKPTGIAFDLAGNLYIADSANHRVRRVGTDGLITTIAGTGRRDVLDTPMDVAIDARGNLYIADTGNHRVRRLAATIAGTGEAGRGPDFADATQSALSSPLALGVNRSGDVFVVDWQNYLIRKVTFDGKPALTPGGVVNAASFTEPVAPGSIITLFGANLAPGTEISSSWPTELGGAQVLISGAPIRLYVVTPGQVAGELPRGIAPGRAEVTLRTAGAASNTITVPVAAHAPGLFGLGGGRAAAQNQDFSLNSPANPEARGNIVVAYLTGLGAPSEVSVTIGGVAAEVLYAGATPGAIGLDQLNIRIPSSAPVGAAVPVIVRAGGEASVAATISVR